LHSFGKRNVKMGKTYLESSVLIAFLIIRELLVLDHPFWISSMLALLARPLIFDLY